jgi:hypothetical protein
MADVSEGASAWRGSGIPNVPFRDAERALNITSEQEGMSLFATITHLRERALENMLIGRSARAERRVASALPGCVMAGSVSCGRDVAAVGRTTR